MKLSCAVLVAALAGCSAFTAPVTQNKAFVLRMETEEAQSVVAEGPAPTPVKPSPKMSESLPFMECPPALDGSMAGDVGFDPFGFAKTKEDLMNYREAEVKHARLAMLVRH